MYETSKGRNCLKRKSAKLLKNIHIYEKVAFLYVRKMIRINLFTKIMIYIVSQNYITPNNIPNKKCKVFVNCSVVFKYMKMTKINGEISNYGWKDSLS